MNGNGKDALVDLTETAREIDSRQIEETTLMKRFVGGIPKLRNLHARGIPSVKETRGNEVGKVVFDWVRTKKMFVL